MSIRTLFLFAIASALVIPLVAMGVLRLYEVSLLRTTERQLIAQSIVAGETFREALDLAHTDALPPHARGHLAPREPGITGDTEISPPMERGRKCLDAAALNQPHYDRVSRILKRAQARTLAVVRILDPSGCVVVSSTGHVGRSYADSSEIKRAMAGEYGHALRLRKKGKTPPLGSMSRRGRTRVFTALPVFADGRLIGIVAASRTGLDPISRLFQQRRGYLLLMAISILCILILVFAASASIVRPIRSLTQHARRLKAGTQKERWKPSFMAPKETVLLGEVLDDASSALRDRADAVAEFARNVSHELKTPITAVRGAGELLRDDGSEMTEAQRIRFADNIVKDASRMSRLVGRLLQLARLDNPKAFDEPTSVDVVEAAGEAAIRNERIVLSVSGQPRPIMLSLEHFESLVGNCLDNALSYGQGRIDLRLEFGVEGVDIKVSDEGPGIPENHIEKVCEPFFTTSRNEGGTGLGLSIVKAIVSGLSGTLDIESNSSGTTIRIHLPDKQR